MNSRWLGKLLVMLLGLPLPYLAAADWSESFDADPFGEAWRTVGDTNLFTWNSTSRGLIATWDSSRPNSFFCRPLGTILTKQDNFSFAFDLRLSDIAIGVHPNKLSTFQLALGLVGFESVTDANVQRGTGVNVARGARNTIEFDSFPDSGFGATISPTILSSNNQFATVFAFPLALDPGALFYVAMTYSASNQMMRTTMTRDGVAFGPIPDVVLDSTFTDFRLDHFALINWSDAGAGGSLLAHGIVDNIVVEVPDPLITDLTGRFADGAWQTSFKSRGGWVYTLERSENFREWITASSVANGNGATLTISELSEPNATTTNRPRAFYRVRAGRP